MACLSYRLIATLLAATYLVVGGLGESLHYVVQSLGSAPVEQTAQSHSLMHHHGDGHWHHHGSPASDAPDANAETTDTSNSITGEFRTAWQHDHGCLLLALVSQLQHSVSLATSIAIAACDSAQFSVSGAPRVVGCILTWPEARGPPRRLAV